MTASTTRADADLQIDVTWQPRNSWRAVAMLRRVAEYTLQAEGFTHGRLSVVVIGATAMATLHRKFRGSPNATDVLTFDLESDPQIGIVDADIVVCTDVARRRAARRGGSLEIARAELALYLVHGILHLASYDDHTTSEFRRMHAREDELLLELGLGAVYRAGAAQ